MPKIESIKRKSILKSSSTVVAAGEAATTTCKKSTTFDEENIIKTLHPKDKDYGNQTIAEPKTPFERPFANDKSKPVDPQLLHARLVDLEKQQLQAQQSSLSFAAKRKQHYNEYRSIEVAKMLLTEEEIDERDATAEIQQGPTN